MAVPLAAARVEVVIEIVFVMVTVAHGAFLLALGRVRCRTVRKLYRTICVLRYISKDSLSSGRGPRRTACRQGGMSFGAHAWLRQQVAAAALEAGVA
jgi:hypothetical protein